MAKRKMSFFMLYRLKFMKSNEIVFRVRCACVTNAGKTGFNMSRKNKNLKTHTHIHNKIISISNLLFTMCA